MISKIKKPVSILLVFMMIVSLFAVVPITASAAEQTITVNSGNDKLSNHGIQNLHYGNHSDFNGNGLPWGTFVAPTGKVFTKIVTNGTNDAMNWTGSAERVDHDGMMGEWYIDWETDEDGFRPFTISFTLADAITTYTVTWKNGDTTLKTDTVDKDAIPAYTGETPKKAEDANYTYTFSGWKNGTNTYGKDETLPAVTANVIYTATFAAEDKAVKNVIALINALPAAAEITAADKAQIEAARAAYNLLSGDQKELVTNLDKLTAAETALAAAEKLFAGHSVTLGGNIGVNFFINSKTADFAHAGSAVVKFTWDGGGEDRTKEVDLTKLTTNNDGYYTATVDVVAAQMAHKIHAEVYLNSEMIGEEQYSVQDYAEAVYAEPGKYLPADDADKAPALKALAAAMLHYGGEAQTVFATSLTEHPDRADSNLDEAADYSGVTADAVTAKINGTASNLNAVAADFDAEFYTSSLVYLSKNTLRLYFTPASKTVGGLDNVEGFTDNLKRYYYYADKEDIAAAELDDQQEFTVGNVSFNFSALDYVVAVLNSSNMSPKQKNLAKSLFLYNQAANEYFDDAPAPVENVVDLSTLNANYEAQNNDVLTGALEDDYKITIADGATITLRNANITLNDDAFFAGITPVGDATIMLEGTNTVKGGYQDYPGIFVPVGKTLTIDGTGSLTASSGGDEDKSGCGIGGGRFNIKAGNIVINGGTITANGGEWAAGIGSGPDSTCGNITITGGTITANGGEEAAGIGSGSNSTCGDITIAGTVTQVTATRGEYAEASIGAGESGTCGTVTIADPSKVIQN